MRKLKIRTLSIKSSQLLEQHLDIVSPVIPNLYVWGSPQEHDTLKIIDEKIPFIVFAGRPTNDKGYDRFCLMRSEKYHKVHVGAEGINTASDTYLGWLDPEQVKLTVSEAGVIIYPARQIDCDPLIMQLALEYKIPIVVDAQNAAANTVFKFYGENCVVTNWNDFRVDSLHPGLSYSFNYSHVDINEIDKFYRDCFH